MKFRVIGVTIENGNRYKTCYDEFDEYCDAFDYKEWLENPKNWKITDKKQPYMFYIEEIETDGDKYFDEAMTTEEQK